MKPNHLAVLRAFVGPYTELRYAFVATPKGRIVAQLGNRNDLPHTDVIDTTAGPESIKGCYEECLAYRSTRPHFNPRLYAQGRTQGIIDCQRAPVSGGGRCILATARAVRLGT